MKSSNKFSSKLILIPTLLVVAISFLILTISGFNYDNLSGLVTSYGVLGAVFYMALGVLSIVLAPTSTIPLWPVVLGAYGFWDAAVFFFLGKAISLTLIPSIAVMIGMYFLAVFIGVKVWRYYLKVEKKSK